jgi:ribosomal protein S27AE
MADTDQDKDARTLEAKGELWRCPKCGSRWTGDMVATWKQEGRCGRCEIGEQLRKTVE